MHFRELGYSKTISQRLLQLTIATALLLSSCTPAHVSSQGSKPAAPVAVGSAETAQISRRFNFPLEKSSVRFAVIGDSGTGGQSQYEMAREMAECHAEFPFDFVLMLGDNIYGGKTPADFELKFERPYKPLLDSGVTFYASLGNHDETNERYYKPFNMNGQRYYTFKKGNARFFALDSNYMDPQQLKWFEDQLRGSSEPWKICFFHHPLYSDARTHGPDIDLRARLEPLLEKYDVNIVFSGHDHVYERFKPQHGLYYFVVGNSGQLRTRNLRPSSQMDSGFDTDRTFMMVEISKDDFYFETVSRSAVTVDAGKLSLHMNP
jgi:3',5'-cyclic AMP phosphodiesterase CpdA